MTLERRTSGFYIIKQTAQIAARRWPTAILDPALDQGAKPNQDALNCNWVTRSRIGRHRASEGAALNSNRDGIPKTATTQQSRCFTFYSLLTLLV
jgi:hypothetical protein